MRMPADGESAESVSPRRVKLLLALKSSANGSPNTTAADATSGSVRIRSRRSETARKSEALVGYFVDGSASVNVTTRSGLNPGSTRWSEA
jgi:hypothetical protein